MADWLLSFAAGAAGDVGVAIETPRGPVVESLMEHGIAVHSINPKQLDRFRDRLSPAGAKDDRRDARVLASALRTDPHCFRRLEPTDPTIVALREWSRLSEELTRERVRLANRMREQLWRYYPQFLDAVGDDVAAPWALELWRRLPTPRAGQRVREVTLTRVLKEHRIRRTDAATLRTKLRAPAVKVAPGAVEAAVTHVELVAERLVLVKPAARPRAAGARRPGGTARRDCFGGRPGRVRRGRTGGVETAVRRGGDGVCIEHQVGFSHESRALGASCVRAGRFIYTPSTRRSSPGASRTRSRGPDRTATTPRSRRGRRPRGRR